jgi:hypothetical protein
VSLRRRTRVVTQADIVAAVETALAADRARQPLPAKPKRDWVQTLTGVGIILTAIAAVAALIFTRQTIQQGQQGQITDRYNAAITNLGSTSIEVRLGGVYALQRLMQDSPKDEFTVLAVLCAFVRNQASPANKPSKSDPTTDILAALDVVAESRPLGKPIGCRLPSVDLAGVNLAEADLGRTDLSHADLVHTNFTAANLRAADLVGANLAGAYLGGADLAGADLRHADLTGANLRDAKLVGAKWPKGFPVPKGWVLDPRSGRLSRAQAGA